MRSYTYNPFKLKKDEKMLIAFAVSLALYMAFSITYFSAVSGEIRESVVRLHILAESNSESDQSVKLKVRDALLEKNTDLLSDKFNCEKAEEYFEKNKDELEKTANKVLEENGKTYKAKITLGKEFYTTRVYEELTFPAGIYTSLKVVLGEGKGENWWCVMFPPLCVPAVSGEIENDENINLEEYITKDGEKIVSSKTKFKMKFKILEVYEELVNNIK